MTMSDKDKIIKECIKQNIKKYRVTNELTQSQVCAAIGTSRTTYTKWESGGSMPNIVQLAKLGMIYGVKTDAFLDGMDQFSVAC
ncbi:MAG: helix-turn-helix transcriptional regulator, partial [Ruminococcus sp.]|nr:helix-turn-helix transcriptional regulator [Ruminococcus sp.]